MMESDSDPEDQTLDLLHIGSDDETYEANSEISHVAETGEGLDCESSSRDEIRQSDDDESSESDHCLPVDHHSNQTLSQPCPEDDAEPSNNRDPMGPQQHQSNQLLQSTPKDTSSAVTSSEVNPGSNEEHEVTASELQVYSLPVPGTSSGISPVGGTVSTGTRHVTQHIPGQLAVDFLQSASSSGWDTTVDTRDSREVHVHMTKNIIKDSAVNMGGKTFINPPGKKQKKQPRTQSVPTPAQKLRQSTENHVAEWTKGMIHTAATQSILDLILQGKTWVTVTGCPGEGKTTAAYLTLKKLHGMGREVYEIRTPDDYFKVKESNGSVLMFNDILGSNKFSQDNLEKWKPVLTDIFDMKEHRDMMNLGLGEEDTAFLSQRRHTCVILVSRSTVLHSAASHLDRFKDYIFENVVNLTRDIEGSPQERLDIWKYHADRYNVNIDENTVMDVCSMSLSHGFSHCCRLFAIMFSKNKNLSMKLFFSKPIEFLHEAMESLLYDSTVGPLLREMLKHDGCLQLDSITDYERRYQYKTIAERLKGIYLKEENDSVTFHHPSVYDSAAFAVCRKDPLFVIRYCSMSFLNERIRIQGLRSEEKEVLGTLPIDSKYTDTFIDRLKTELADGNISMALSHSSFHDQGFVEKFMKAIWTDSQFSLESDFIQEVIHQTDKKTKHLFLFYSIKNKSEKILRYICNKISLSQHERTNVLFGVCEFSSVSSLKFLLNQDGNIPLDVEDENLNTPLLIASKTSCGEILKLLIEADADVTVRDKEGTSVLYHICVNGVDGDGDVVRMLIDKGVDVNWKSKSYLIIATQQGHISVITALIEKGAHVNKRDGYNNSALLCACFRGYSKIIHTLCEKGADINMATENGIIPFHAACAAGHVNAMMALLERGVVINQKNKDDSTALHYACSGGHVNVMTALLDRGVDISQTNKDDVTALQLACTGGHVNVMTAMLDRGVDINQANKDGITVLQLACVKGHVNVMTALLDRGVDINQTAKDGVTALHSACAGGHVNVMTALLDRGVDINLTTEDGSTGLHSACAKGHVNVITALLDRGVDINQTTKIGSTALLSACARGHDNVMTALLDRGVDINQTDKDGHTALHCACAGGRVNVMTALLDRGVDINQTNKDGVTALHCACARGHVNVMTALLDRGVDINQTDKDGHTALHCACKAGHVNVVTALLDRGVDINKTNMYDQTPLNLVNDPDCELYQYLMEKSSR